MIRSAICNGIAYKLTQLSSVAKLSKRANCNEKKEKGKRYVFHRVHKNLI